MLSLNVTVQGDKIVLRGLRGLERSMPNALKRILTRAAVGTYRAAFEFLSGPGAKASKVAAGGYPVPIRTGHLRRMLAWLRPGESKTSNGTSFKAGPAEAIVYDSAEYSEVIHQGLGSSAKFGARPFITDGFERFNSRVPLEKIAEEEIDAEARTAGFK